MEVEEVSMICEWCGFPNHTLDRYKIFMRRVFRGQSGKMQKQWTKKDKIVDSQAPQNLMPSEAHDDKKKKELVVNRSSADASTLDHMMKHSIFGEFKANNGLELVIHKGLSDTKIEYGLGSKKDCSPNDELDNIDPRSIS